MILRTRISAVFVAAALLATAACESATYSDRAGNGTLSFSYAGSASGSFNASGGYDRLNPSEINWAVGNRGSLETGEQALAVYARTGRGEGNLVNEFILFVEEPRAGTYTCAAEQETCPIAGILILGTTPNGEEAQAIYTAISGTVNIVSVSEDFAQGTFSFTMADLDITDAPPTLQVTSGTFNVPLVAARDF